MADLTTKIGSLQLSSPIMNSAGYWARTEDDFQQLGKSETSAIVFKSFTVEPRDGNPEPRLYWNDEYSLNSIGLANPGVDEYCKLAETLTSFGKPLVANIAGFSEEDYEILFTKANEAVFDAIEVNLSCPNVVGKNIFCYDIATSLKILKKMRDKTKKTLGAKISPYTSREDIQKMAEGLVSIGVDFVSMTNTYPLATVIDAEKEEMAIKPNGGIGGLAGSAIKPISLAQVVLFYPYLKGKVDIIGVGGIEKGSDAYEYILAGATAVQIGSGILKEGYGILGRVTSELNEMLDKKNVNKVSEKIGKLQFL